MLAAGKGSRLGPVTRVLCGRELPKQFVALTSTNHARMYGLAGRKGTISVGADADIAIWHIRLDPGMSWQLPPASAGATRVLYVFEGGEISWTMTGEDDLDIPSFLR